MTQAIVTTGVPGLVLRRFEQTDADALHALVQANRGHLSERGEYTDLIAASIDDLRLDLGKDDGKLRFGLFLDDQLIGRADLIGVEATRYGLGYWLAADATGNGFATAALTALLDHARQALGANDVYAGVGHGNGRSEALLARWGFVPIADFEDFTRFHRALN